MISSIIVCELDRPQGVDFPDVKIVCTAGLPGSTVNTLQRAGRALRNSNADALFVIFYDPWVKEISLDEYTDDLSADPDRPRSQLKPTSQRRERVPLSSLRLVKCGTCLRRQFTEYLNDTSQAGVVGFFSAAVIVVLILWISPGAYN